MEKISLEELKETLPLTEGVSTSFRDVFLDICRNKQLCRYLISKKYDIRDLMIEDGLNIRFCPFHDDEASGKPSIKIYTEDEDEVQRLYCFSENKQYTSYDYFELIRGENPLNLLSKNNIVNENNIQDIKDELEFIKTKKTNENLQFIQACLEASTDPADFLSKIYGYVESEI